MSPLEQLLVNSSILHHPPLTPPPNLLNLPLGSSFLQCLPPTLTPKLPSSLFPSLSLWLPFRPEYPPFWFSFIWHDSKCVLLQAISAHGFPQWLQDLWQHADSNNSGFPIPAHLLKARFPDPPPVSGTTTFHNARFQDPLPGSFRDNDDVKPKLSASIPAPVASSTPPSLQFPPRLPHPP